MNVDKFWDKIKFGDFLMGICVRIVLLIWSARLVKSVINFSWWDDFWLSLNSSDLFFSLDWVGGAVENFFGVVERARIFGAGAGGGKKILGMCTGERSMFGGKAASRSGERSVSSDKLVTAFIPRRLSGSVEFRYSFDAGLISLTLFIFWAVK